MALEELAAVSEPVDEVIEQPEMPEEGVAEAVDEVEEPKAVEEDVQGDGRLISPKWRELQKTNPELFKEYKSLFFGKKAFDDSLPGGKKELDDILGYLTENGGKEGLATKLTELSQSAEQLTQLDEMLKSADPKILDRVQQLNPDAINSLAPEMLNRWNQQNPDECNKMLCGVIANTFRNGNLDSTLNAVRYALKYNDAAEATNLIDQLQQWSKTFGEAANKPSAPKQAPKTDELDKQRQELNERAQSMFTEDLNAKIGQAGESIIVKELDPFLKGKEISDTKKEILRSTINSRIDARLKGDAAYQSKVMSFVKSKDVQGAVKAFQAKLAEVAPIEIGTVARELLGQPAKAKTAAAPVAKVPTPAAREETDPRKQLFNSIYNR